jgi:hypothetical protein
MKTVVGDGNFNGSTIILESVVYLKDFVEQLQACLSWMAISEASKEILFAQF